jgi:DNA polymerase III subunit delta'
MPFDISRYQPKAWSILARSAATGHTASTYLFYGREGLGHWPLAISFAALLNCRNQRRSEFSGDVLPCGECDSCRQIFGVNSAGLFVVVPIMSFDNMTEAVELTNQALDQKRSEPFTILTAPKQTSLPIDMAREIKRHLMLKETSGSKRVVLFYQMEKMLQSSADALLKLIEEPPEDSVILLTAERLEALLPTIQSRAQHIRLDRVPEEAAIAYLVDGYRLESTRAKLLIRLANRNLGQAIDLASHDDGDDDSRRGIGLMLYKSLFHDTNPQVVARLVDLMPRSDRGEAEELLQLWQSLTRDCANFAVNGDEDELTNIDFLPEIKACAPKFGNSDLAAGMLPVIKNALADLRLNVHIQVALIAVVLRLTRLIRTTS